MSDTRQFYRPGPVLSRVLGPFAWRPHLTSGVAAGLVLGIALRCFAPDLGWSASLILAWDLTCLWFIAFMLNEMRGRVGDDIKAKVAAQDEGQGLITAVVLVAAVLSIATVSLELSLAKDDHGFWKVFRIGSAVATVFLSWFTVQLVFALHYAHEYYAPDKETVEDDVIGGLEFPGGQPPDYWDFLHFAVVIGVASQTADIAFTSKSMRRLGTVHGLISWVFNTVVLALTINLCAGLF